METSIKLEILRGTLDEKNPLSILRANPLVWSKIFDNVQAIYNYHILRSNTAYKIMQHLHVYQLEFPEPKDININMMPIKAGGYYDTIPSYLNQYRIMIYNCTRFCDVDTTVYLTIHESLVEPNTSQRRPGVHIERPGSIADGGSILTKDWKNPEFVNMYRNLEWGLGSWQGDIPKDGIFMMSSVSDSCHIWPVQIKDPEKITDKHGGIEYMRPYLGEPYKLRKNELVWFTDTTPHESLPIQGDKPVYRQFFRLVIGKISVWYSKHNTPNPLGILPDASISDEDKFV